MKENHESTAIARVEPSQPITLDMITSLRQAGVVAPQMLPAMAQEASRLYQATKAAILSDSDYIWCVGKKIFTDRSKAEAEAKQYSMAMKGHPKKSGCLKLGQAFGVRVEIVGEQWATDGSWVDVTARATHPCGAIGEDTASCERLEKRNSGKSKYGEEKDPQPLSRHNMRTTAYTRARNRAILALIGGGEVSGEELTAGGEVEPGEYLSPGPMQPAVRVDTAPVPPSEKRNARPVAEPSPDAHPGESWKRASRRLHAMVREAGLADEQAKKLLAEWYGVDSSTKLLADTLHDFADRIEREFMSPLAEADTAAAMEMEMDEAAAIAETAQESAT